MKFIITDIDTKLSLKLANFFSFRNADNLPTIRLVDNENNIFRRFTFSRNLTRSSIVTFIQKWKENEYKPYNYLESFESDTIRETKDSIVKKINYNSFYETVNFNRRNVVVLFYTEWCSHCKKVFYFLNFLDFFFV